MSTGRTPSVREQLAGPLYNTSQLAVPAGSGAGGGGTGGGSGGPPRSLFGRLGIRKPSLLSLTSPLVPPAPTQTARTFSLDDLLKQPPGSKDHPILCRPQSLDIVTTARLHGFMSLGFNCSNRFHYYFSFFYFVCLIFYISFFTHHLCIFPWLQFHHSDYYFNFFFFFFFRLLLSLLDLLLAISSPVLCDKFFFVLLVVKNKTILLFTI